MVVVSWEYVFWMQKTHETTLQKVTTSSYGQSNHDTGFAQANKSVLDIVTILKQSRTIQSLASILEKL